MDKLSGDVAVAPCHPCISPRSFCRTSHNSPSHRSFDAGSSNNASYNIQTSISHHPTKWLFLGDLAARDACPVRDEWPFSHLPRRTLPLPRRRWVRGPPGGNHHGTRILFTLDTSSKQLRQILVCVLASAELFLPSRQHACPM